MTPEDEKYLNALLTPVKQDLQEIKRNWGRDVDAISSRLNLLEKNMAVMQAKAEINGGIFGAVTGLVCGILGEILAARFL